MKKLFKLIFTSLLLLSSSLGYAQDEETLDYPEQPTRLEPEQPTKRKRIPAQDYLECIYDGNGLFITPVYCEDPSTFNITVSNGSEYYSGEVEETNGYYFQTGPLKGNYTITCIGNSNRVYTGLISILSYL